MPIPPPPSNSTMSHRWGENAKVAFSCAVHFGFMAFIRFQTAALLHRVSLSVFHTCPRFRGHPSAVMELPPARPSLHHPLPPQVFLESILLELRAGNMQAAIQESLAALEIHRGTGRLWAVLIQLKQCEGEHEQSRVFREALKEVPKSGEVWCEGARICMNPLSSKFNLAQAQQFLDFAIKFTPQYGDSFIEYLRLELLTTGNAINSQLEQLCVNAEPNYGPMWSAPPSVRPTRATPRTLVGAKECWGNVAEGRARPWNPLQPSSSSRALYRFSQARGG